MRENSASARIAYKPIPVCVKNGKPIDWSRLLDFRGDPTGASHSPIVLRKQLQMIGNEIYDDRPVASGHRHVEPHLDGLAIQRCPRQELLCASAVARLKQHGGGPFNDFCIVRKPGESLLRHSKRVIRSVNKPVIRVKASVSIT